MYTIEQVKDIDINFLRFAVKTWKYLNETFDAKVELRDFNLKGYVDTHRVTICKKDQTIVGVMLMRQVRPLFNSKQKVLIQDILYTVDPKATALLLKDFIDFGKSNVDHIITMLTPHTNIKAKSLERLGFKQLETFFRMEISDGPE